MVQCNNKPFSPQIQHCQRVRNLWNSFPQIGVEASLGILKVVIDRFLISKSAKGYREKGREWG